MAEKMNPMHTFALAGVPDKDLPHKLAKLACDEHERSPTHKQWHGPEKKLVTKILQQYTPRGKRGERLDPVWGLAVKHWKKRSERRQRRDGQPEDYLLCGWNEKYHPEKMVERMLLRLEWRRPDKYETQVSQVESFTGENFRRLANVCGLPLAIFCDDHFYTRNDEPDSYVPKAAGMIVCDDAIIFVGLDRMDDDDDRGPIQEAHAKLVSLAAQLNRCLGRRKKK